MRADGIACLLVLVLAGLSAACGGDDTTARPCGDGALVEVGGRRFCAYRDPLVIEGGFRCPEALPYRIDLEGAAVCTEEPTDRRELPSEVCARIDRPCEGPADAGPTRQDAGTDAGPRDTGTPRDSAPDPDGGTGGSYWRLEPATADFLVAAERCSYAEGRTTLVRVTLHWFSSCDEPGPVEVAVDPMARAVTLAGWVWRHEGRDDCTPVGAAIDRDVEVPGLTAGDWTINGSVPLRVEGPPPPITCTAPGPEGSACLADCDCLDGARCLGVRGDAVCALRCARPCARGLDPAVADLACPGGGVCADDPDLGQICAGRSMDACGTSTACPAGTSCVADADFASYCDWSVRLGAAPRHACTTDGDCDSGLSCVEGTDTVRTCELRCASERMPCPGPGAHACLPEAARAGSRWVCEWLGE